jgi:hypothetical protein
MVLQKNFTKSRNGHLMSLGFFYTSHNLADLDIFDRLFGIDFSKRAIVRIP